jgi:hypothetical protein
VTALWAAIVNGDPERGRTCFFPLSAYLQVKAVRDPARDFTRRLLTAYTRDIRTLHTRLGPGAARARLLRLEVPETRIRWVDPGQEWNRLGYYRVYGAKLVYEIDGRAQVIPIASLISWRGEWYVVHLSGFR